MLGEVCTWLQNIAGSRFMWVSTAHATCHGCDTSWLAASNFPPLVGKTLLAAPIFLAGQRPLISFCWMAGSNSDVAPDCLLRDVICCLDNRRTTPASGSVHSEALLLSSDCLKV